MPHRGPRKHLKRPNAPAHWMLDKYGGTWAPRPREGPHKLRESIPLAVLLRNRLKYALNYRECFLILQQRLVTVDGKVRTDQKFPVGLMDVVSIEKTGDNFRLIYDVKGRFIVHKIDEAEAQFKLCQVRNVKLGKNGIPSLHTHDGRTVRYPNPDIMANDTVKVDVNTGKIIGHVRFEVGNLAMVSGGRNLGRVGVIENREKHPGSFEIVHIRDAAGQRFATRLSNVFVIGEEKSSLITLPKRKGVKLDVLTERRRRFKDELISEV